MGGDPEQDYFVDGVTESLTTDLSRMSGMWVIGRNTAFTYKGKAVDLKQIGRELSVRYVLEGSVQRGASRMRVNVQLVDAESGNHLWADRFDKPIADLFEMQDEIVARLANALDAQLASAEARRAERSPNPDSMDQYFRGVATYNKGFSRENLWQARGLFESALALDSSNIEALVGMARADFMAAFTYQTDDRAASLAAVEAASTKALSLAPDHIGGHLLTGMVQISSNRAAQGVAKCERALALDRNLALAHGYIGQAKVFLGHAEETEAHVLTALRLSPRDTYAFLITSFAGVAQLYLAHDDEAIAWMRRSIEANRNLPYAHFFLAAALAHRGGLDEARKAVQAGLALDRKFTISRFRAGPASDNPTYLAQREHVYEGMRKAGVPEG
jgi:TolB-like protein